MGVLDGKVAVVTGITSGIGAATARLFAQEGARVFAAGHPGSSLDAVDEISVVDCDSGSPDDLARLADTVRIQAGRVGTALVRPDLGRRALRSPDPCQPAQPWRGRPRPRRRRSRDTQANSSSRVSRPAVAGRRTRSPGRHCSSPPRRPASLPAPIWSSTAE